MVCGCGERTEVYSTLHHFRPSAVKRYRKCPGCGSRMVTIEHIIPTSLLLAWGERRRGRGLGIRTILKKDAARSAATEGEA